MRHSKKKFVKYYTLGKGAKAVLDSSQPASKEFLDKLEENNYEGYYSFVVTDTDKLIQAFIYQELGAGVAIIEPNPAVVYFEVARNNSVRIPAARTKLLEEANHTGNTANNIYQFAQLATISGAFMFAALEAFINNLIPHEYIYRRSTSKSTEVYDRFQIQKSLPFKDKVKDVVPDFTKKKFHQEHPEKYQLILQLQELRDSVMHTKSDENAPPKYYRSFFTKTLDFDFAKALQATKDYINYYEPSLIEECDCGRDDVSKLFTGVWRKEIHLGDKKKAFAHIMVEGSSYFMDEKIEARVEDFKFTSEDTFEFILKNPGGEEKDKEILIKFNDDMYFGKSGSGYAVKYLRIANSITAKPTTNT